MANSRNTARTFGTAIRTLLIATVVLGVGYPAVLLGVGQLALPAQANGSIIHNAAGEPVGSALLAQPFIDDEGNPLPEYFQSRPSAVDHDPANSSGTNLGPENPDLLTAIQERIDAGKTAPDALTSSSSGLDPHISVENAMSQATEVSEARGVSETEVKELVESMTQARDIGYLGEPTVNVLQLNLALDELMK